MAVYRYIAIAQEGGTRARGARSRGVLAADTTQQVRAALRRMGLAPIRVTEARAPQPSLFRTVFARLTRSHRRSALVELYESLAALLSSGTPLAPALALLASSRSGASGLARLLAESVREGSSLSTSMTGRPEWFGAVDTALIASAQESGDLAGALAALAEEGARAEELSGKVIGALAYPALLFVFGLGVVVFLTTTTLPQLAGVIADAGGALPRSTAALLAVGDIVTAQWPMVMALGALVTLGAVWLARTPRLARARLRVPLFGPLALRSQTAGASLLLARLLEGGVPLAEALGLCAPTVRNPALRSALLSVREDLTAGGGVAAAITLSGLFDPVFARVLEVGEASGELAPALRSAGERQRTRARRAADRLAAALEPAVILILAAMIGFMVYAAITPMLRLAQTLS